MLLFGIEKMSGLWACSTGIVSLGLEIEVQAFLLLGSPWQHFFLGFNIIILKLVTACYIAY